MIETPAMPVASLVRRELKQWEVLQAERYIRRVQCDEDEALERKVRDTSNRFGFLTSGWKEAYKGSM